MFSDALREMDKNTERYMVEELNKEVAELKSSNVKLHDALSEKDDVIKKLTEELSKYK